MGSTKNGIKSCFYEAKWLWIGTVPLLLLLLVLLCIVDPLIRSYQKYGFLILGLHTDLLQDAFQADALVSFLPLLSVLPFAGTYIDEVKTKFSRFIIFRGSYQIYGVCHAISGFLLGTLVIGIGVLLSVLVVTGVLFPLERKVEGIEPDGAEFLLETCILLCLNGGLWSLVGLTASTLMESKYISYAAPFVLYYFLVILSQRYFPDLFLLSPANWVDPSPWPFEVWGAAIFLLELSLGCGIIFSARAARRLKAL